MTWSGWPCLYITRCSNKRNKIQNVNQFSFLVIIERYFGNPRCGFSIGNQYYWTLYNYIDIFFNLTFNVHTQSYNVILYNVIHRNIYFFLNKLFKLRAHTVKAKQYYLLIFNVPPCQWCLYMYNTGTILYIPTYIHNMCCLWSNKQKKKK